VNAPFVSMTLWSICDNLD